MESIQSRTFYSVAGTLMVKRVDTASTQHIILIADTSDALRILRRLTETDG